MHIYHDHVQVLLGQKNLCNVEGCCADNLWHVDTQGMKPENNSINNKTTQFLNLLVSGVLCTILLSTGTQGRYVHVHAEEEKIRASAIAATSSSCHVSRVFYFKTFK